MIKTAIKSILVMPKTLLAFSMVNIRPQFNFCSFEKVLKDLRQVTSNQINHQEQNIENMSKFQNFFKENGWSLRYNSLQVQLVKDTEEYNRRILFNAKTPIITDQNEQQSKNKNLSDSEFIEIHVYLKKQDSQKWLSCQFIVESDGKTYLNVLNFIQDYEKERKNRSLNKQFLESYDGRPISTLSKNFQKAINQFIKSIGISSPIFENIAQFAISYQHKFYIEWLKNIRSIV